MKYILIIIWTFFIGTALKAQVNSDFITGQISFIGSQNVYVKFQTTDGILAGDTLFRNSNGDKIPVLLVTNLSSTSCMCKSFAEIELSVADPVVARIRKEIKKDEKQETSPVVIPTPDTSAVIKNSKPVERIRGSIAAVSYSDFSSYSSRNSQRFRYTVSMDAKNIGNSKFSASTYISFRHKVGDWKLVKDDLFNALKIYNLSLRYDLDKTSQLSIGRSINQKISSVGALDGLQFEKNFSHLSVGAIAGTRPDYRNYGFNKNLFQYGAYLALNMKKANVPVETSLAFMQQTNNGKTDRRFLYFQHSNYLIKKVYFFSSVEADLFKLNNDQPQNVFNLTGIYLLMRYNLNSKINFSGSYDARKNVIYYESYKNTIDTLIEKELRQGFRLQANYRITNRLNFGIQSGYRFLNSDPKPSSNLYGYLNYNQIPWLNISATISATYMQSAYLDGKIFGGTIYRDFFNSKLQTSVGYRYIDYNLPESVLNMVQHSLEASISRQFKSVSLSLDYEGTIESSDKFNHLYIQVRKRF